MSDGDKRAFVNDFVKFLRGEINQMSHSPDLVESLEVAMQCLEAVYEAPAVDTDIDIWNLYQTAREIAPPERQLDGEALKNEGNRLMKEEKYQEALVSYNRAICSDPRNPIFYCNRAAAWIRLGDYDRAIADSQMSLKYNPTYCKAHARLGDALTKVNRLEEALTAYQEAVRLEPDNSYYQNKLDVTRQRIQDTPQTQDGASGHSRFNQGIAEMATRIMSDPMINEVFANLNDFNSIESLLDTGRQLATQMGAQNPQLLSDIRRLLQTNPNIYEVVSTIQQMQQNNEPRPPQDDQTNQ